ncbi:MAG: hypothetical protein RM022_027090 [Nostoc sp. EfeVER01]|uniref:hypothetical protein n=1 Tax=unclassified Nostoc TaxID=2593658 RepID=UPI002AD22C3F|nr:MULTISPECIES: hypothetical protein [unclassified Nostoc]MDZ7944845.1 hypothetical protein [Nostoc sp. EfeVER01]MDZ7994062.1 hypothetical protein [Nostoc sp. EspVER01]
MVIESQQPPSVFHNSSAIARYDLYVLTLTLRSSKAEMVTFFETKKITSMLHSVNETLTLYSF